MCYRLRTLLILLALGPPAMAWGWSEYGKYREHQRQRLEWIREMQRLEKIKSRYPGWRYQLDVF
jgi:hypothetical protein